MTRKKRAAKRECDDLRYHRFVRDGQHLGFGGDFVRHFQFR